MSYEGYIAIASVIISLLVAYGGLRKGKADTFSTYQDALAKAQKNYDDLNLRVDKLEEELQNKQTWNRALCNQLVENSLTPITMAQAVKYSNGK